MVEQKNHREVKDILDQSVKGLEDFIRSSFTLRVNRPGLVLNQIMDYLFENQNWWEYEPETIKDDLSFGGIVADSEILGRIQAIAALRHGQSFIDKEWHLFEKAVCTLTGIPVMFYDKQDLQIENVIHAVNVMSKMAKLEFSEEVLFYIGSTAIGDEILWHPTSFVDKCITMALSKIGADVGLDIKSVAALREETKTKFDEMSSSDINKVEIDDSDAASMQCAGIMKSLIKGKFLKEWEMDSLQSFISVKEGGLTVEGLTPPSEEDKAPDVTPPMDTEVEILTADMIPDTREFDDTMKVAFAEFLDTTFVRMSKTALSGASSLPIITGIPMSGSMDSPDDPNKDLVKTSPRAGSADALMEMVKNDIKNEKKEKDENPNTSPEGFDLFEL